MFEGDKTLDAATMCTLIVESLSELSLSHHLLVGVTRDNASYMVKALELMQTHTSLSHVLSVSCLSHGLNLVIRALLNPFVEIRDSLFSTLKKLFAKPSARRTRQWSGPERFLEYGPGFPNSVGKLASEHIICTM